MVEDIEDLLFYISEKESDVLTAEKAFIKIYQEYSPLVFNAIKKTIFFISESEKNEFANTVTNNTFLEVYLKPLNFSYDVKVLPSKEIAFKAYLLGIAKNEKNDLLQESLSYSNFQVKIIDGDEDFFVPFVSDDVFKVLEEKLSQNRLLLDEILLTLSDRDRYIILSFYDNYEEGKKTPSEVLDFIESIYGTTRENIRMIRSRVRKRLIKEIESKSDLKAI